MSWWQDAISTVGDTVSGAYDTVADGAQEWVKNEVGDWVGSNTSTYQPGRAETVNTEESPEPAAGPQAAQNQAAAAMGAQMQQLMKYGGWALAAVAAYLIIEQVRS